MFYTHTLPHFQPRSKYPAVSSERERSRYAAVFQDQYAEFLELQQEVGSAQAKLQQLEALLTSLPPPRSQVNNQVETPTPESFQVARQWPSAHLLSPDLRPLPPPRWAGTTAYGQTALEVLPRLAGHFVSLSLSFCIPPWIQHSLSLPPPFAEGGSSCYPCLEGI